MKNGSKMGGVSSSSIVANSDGNNVTITIPKSMLSTFSNADGDVTVTVPETKPKSEGIGAYKNMIFVGLIGVVIGYIATKAVR